MVNQPKLQGSYESRIRTVSVRLARWTGAWVVTCVLAGFGPKLLWNRSMAFTLLAVGLNVCVGVGMILATKDYLAELDELQKKIYLNAMGITFGVVLIASVSFQAMDKYDVFHANISHLVMLMCLTFGVSFKYSNWRYR